MRLFAFMYASMQTSHFVGFRIRHGKYGVQADPPLPKNIISSIKVPPLVLAWLSATKCLKGIVCMSEGGIDCMGSKMTAVKPMTDAIREPVTVTLCSVPKTGQ